MREGWKGGRPGKARKGRFKKLFVIQSSKPTFTKKYSTVLLESFIQETVSQPKPKIGGSRKPRKR